MSTIIINGDAKDVSHLHENIVTVPGKGKDGEDLKVAVRLGKHTISKSCLYGQHNMTDENGRPRIFCEQRYSYSILLPDLASRMILGNYFCWDSSDKNRAMNYAIIDVEPCQVSKLKNGIYQIVYFYLYPESAREDKAHVRLFITSCYSREINFDRPKRRYNIHSVLRSCLYQQKRFP